MDGQNPALEWLWFCFIKLNKYFPVFTISNLYFWDQGFILNNLVKNAQKLTFAWSKSALKIIVYIKCSWGGTYQILRPLFWFFVAKDEYPASCD